MNSLLKSTTKILSSTLSKMHSKTKRPYSKTRTTLSQLKNLPSGTRIMPFTLKPKSCETSLLNTSCQSKIQPNFDFNCRTVNPNCFTLRGTAIITQKFRVAVKPEKGTRLGVEFGACNEPEDSSAVEGVQLLQEAECECEQRRLVLHRVPSIELSLAVSAGQIA